MSGLLITLGDKTAYGATPIAGQQATIGTRRRSGQRCRTNPALLAELAGRAGQHGAAGPAQVAMVVADSGQRQARTLELMGMVSSAMPQLDESEDVFCVGSASGACGDVSFVTALALAHHAVLVRGAPVLCLGNDDANHCSAQLLRPPPPEIRAS